MEQAVIEDGMTFVMRAGAGFGGVGEDPRRPEVLEVSQLWGDALLDTQHFSQREPAAVTLGSGIGHRWTFLGVDMGWVPSPLHRVLPYTPPLWSEVRAHRRQSFFVPEQAGVDGAEHALFRFENGRYVAVVPDGWDGFVDRGEDRWTLPEAVQDGLAEQVGSEVHVAMTSGVRLGLEHGGITWFARLVPSSARIPGRDDRSVDLPLLGVGGFLAGLAALFAVAVSFAPAAPQVAVADIPDRFLVVQLDPPAPDVPDPTPMPDPSPSAGAEGDPGAGSSRRDPRDVPGTIAEVQHDRLVAQRAGLLSAWSEVGADLDDAALAGGLVDGVGQLIGAKGSQLGINGLGSRGLGGSMGGSIEGLGDGAFGPGGLGPGANGYGGGGRAKPTAPPLVTQDPIVIGSLDASLIDAVIKRHTTQIRYCYQRQLARNPDLGGKLVIGFTIAGDGSVSSSRVKQSSLGSDAVSQCVLGRFQRMRFPEPRGNGVVIVSYPFLFNPG